MELLQKGVFRTQSDIYGKFFRELKDFIIDI